MKREEALARLKAELRGLLTESFNAPKRQGLFPTTDELAREGQSIKRLLSHGSDLADRIIAVATGPENIIETPPAATGKPAVQPQRK